MLRCTLNPRTLKTVVQDVGFRYYQERGGHQRFRLESPKQYGATKQVRRCIATSGRQDPATFLSTMM